MPKRSISFGGAYRCLNVHTIYKSPTVLCSPNLCFCQGHICLYERKLSPPFTGIGKLLRNYCHAVRSLYYIKEPSFLVLPLRVIPTVPQVTTQLHNKLSGIFSFFPWLLHQVIFFIATIGSKNPPIMHGHIIFLDTFIGCKLLAPIQHGLMIEFP